ncbi:hypothetical protein GCM10009546_27790 [Actinomadura livida]|nr:hypothetical protein GCM10010208_36070 [Actinomadura livida]
MPLMAFAAVLCAYVFVWCLKLTMSGGLPDYSTGRLFGMGLVMTAALFLGFTCMLSLRSRVIVSGDGLDIVHTYRREHLPWDEITGITLRYNKHVWDVEVRTSGDARPILVVLVGSIRSTIPWERYDVAPPNTPRRLRDQYGTLREAWHRHREDTGTSSRDSSG